MFIPNDITFQYFFFDTRVGGFLQMLPFALLIAAVYGRIRFHGDRKIPLFQKRCDCLLVCWLVAAAGMTLLLTPVGNFWYWLLYGIPHALDVRFFTWQYRFVPDFWLDWNTEHLSDLLLLVPPGLLYPAAHRRTSFGKTVLFGFLFALILNLLKPVFGRSFELNALLLNTAGVLISASVLCLLTTAHRRRASAG